jgi:prophage regulatory protein
MKRTVDTQKLLTITDVCYAVNRDRRTIWKWVKEGRFIKPVKVHGRTIGFKAEAFNAWLDQQSE